MLESIHERATSGFPVSISTGLALESIFKPRQPVYDPDRKPPVQIDISQYQEFWVNIATLFRNVVAASSREVVLSHDLRDIVSVIEQEIEVINSLFSHEGNNICKPIYYIVDYNQVIKGLHHSIKLRADSTDAQKAISLLLTRVENTLLKHTDEIRTCKPEIKPSKSTDALILTHMPYDLLSHKNFHKLDLLESNTGKLKKKHEWNSKYYPVGKADMSHLPFMKMLLMVFGDRPLIHPGIFKLRDLIIQTSLKRGWTPFTTRDKVMLDLEIDLKEPLLMSILRSIR